MAEPELNPLDVFTEDLTQKVEALRVLAIDICLLLSVILNTFLVHPSNLINFIILILCDKMVDMVKKKYIDDYETIYTNEEGKEKKVITYRGPYYEIDLDQKGLIRLRRNSLLLLILIVFLHIGVGFLNNRGMYQFFYCPSLCDCLISFMEYHVWHFAHPAAKG